jgi:uncharacterized protein involved in high-affinity Fe2+ transport
MTDSRSRPSSGGRDRRDGGGVTRRRLLGAGGAGLLAGLAGCTAAGFGTEGSLFDTTNARAPPLVEPRPAGVYVPTHVEGMGMVGGGSAGDLRVGLSYSYPHRFWTVEREGDGYAARKVEIGRDDAIHLMATAFDPETGQVIPDAGLSVEVYRDGSLVTQETIYRMLSQRMGFHYGANFPLEGDGTYEVRVAVSGVSLSRFGAYEGRFEAPGEARVRFEYSERARNDLTYRLLEDEQGQAGAVRPMQMEMGSDGTDTNGGSGTGADGSSGPMMPVGRASDLPGEPLGRGRVDDLELVATRVSADRFGAESYLAVVARTPYNRLVVPRARIAARAGSAVEGRLTPALDPELGYHYGTSAPGLTADATVEATVETPPIVARHEGYETAFLESGTTRLRRNE